LSNMEKQLEAATEVIKHLTQQNLDLTKRLAEIEMMMPVLLRSGDAAYSFAVSCLKLLMIGKEIKVEQVQQTVTAFDVLNEISMRVRNRPVTVQEFFDSDIAEMDELLKQRDMLRAQAESSKTV